MAKILRPFDAVDNLQNVVAQSLYIIYSSRMTTATHDLSPHASAAYVALRRGGTPPAAARLQLGLMPIAALRLERTFQARKWRDPDALRPRFAHHRRHLAAVLAAGGFPVLPERLR
ncbi:hypothetical protein [Phenylobacterium sp.]|jgi:hypothetical protein|uniref:hypothetical protein n=1 Tax=Phenylobacterium sp. TaxID=1871053 RepID=UPI002F939C4E